jgi:hypothetical protein
MAPGESPINKSTQIGGETFDTMPFTRDYGGWKEILLLAGVLANACFMDNCPSI